MINRIVIGVLCMQLVACASHVDSPSNGTVVANEIEVEGRYERLDGESVLVLRGDSSYSWSDRNMWNGKFYDHPGAYERKGCSGDYKFYTADGDACCMSIEQIGSTVAFKHIDGYRLSVCEGGVYTRVK